MDKTILLAEDDVTLARSLATRLSAKGYWVSYAPNGAIALERFKKDCPHLVLLDVMMPVMDGYEACAEIRKLNRNVPIIFLTALETDADQIKGLKVGGDDYICKTTSDEVLFARIEKAIERSGYSTAAESPKEMTKTESDIYQALKKASGRFLSYRAIFDAISGGGGYCVDEATVRSHVSHMRKKLPEGERIDCKRGFGFCLT